MSHFPPPPQLPPRVRLFQRVPPAIFPPVLGLLGLGVAWRRGGDVFGMPTAVVDIYLGAISLLFLYCIIAYAAKLIQRPSVLAEDIATLPGRTGVAALAMGVMMQAAILVPHAPGLAAALLTLANLALAVLAAHVLSRRIRGTDTTGPVTPALQLVFAGFIVAPLAAVPLGLFPGAVTWLVRAILVIALLLTLLTIRPLLDGKGPVPLRPLQAINLAPAALTATGAFLTGQVWLGQAALVWSAVLFLLLILRARWMTKGGFSPFWSAFTFPLAAFAGALLAAHSVMDSSFLRIAGGLTLIAATLLIPPIAFKILKLWATGGLGAKTAAAIA
jgi:tellurite resistance protein